MGAILLVALLMLPLLPAVAAQADFYVEPANDGARSVKSLFDLTFAIAMFVFLFVHGLLAYILWRFRNNKEVPEGETVRGHTQAEIAWTIIPAIILLFLGVVSAGTLFELDTVPDDVDFTVKVDASQWAWRFTYPDGNYSQYFWDGESPRSNVQAARAFNASKGTPVSVGEFAVEEGSRVRLELHSSDVIHALWIAEFALKIDVVPGRTNVVWFEAPEYKPGGTNEYFLQCAEFCKRGHHAMTAQLVVVPKGSTPNGWPVPALLTPTA